MNAQNLITQLRSENVHHRREAAAMLSWHPDPAAYNALVDLVLHDQDTSVRQQAVRALGQLRTRDALQAILQQLKDQDTAVSMTAAHTLATVMADDLIAVLGDPATTLAERTIAAWALGHCGNYPHVWAALRDASTSADISVREMAQSSLQHLQRTQPTPPKKPARLRRATS